MRDFRSRVRRLSLLAILAFLALFLVGRALKGRGPVRSLRRTESRSSPPEADLPRAAPAPPPDAGVAAPSPAARLEARLEFEEDRQPVPAGVTVTCRGDGTPLQAVTDATGSIVLENLPGPGPHTLLIEGDAFGVGRREIQATVPPDGAPVVWVLERRTVFKGTVRSTDGRTISGAKVSIRAETAGATQCTTVKSGADGTFRIEVGAVTGNVSIGAHGITGFTPTPGTPAEIVPSLREVRIEMPPGPVISGRLVDQEGKPIPGWPFRLLVFQPEGPSADLFPFVFTPTSMPVAGSREGLTRVVHDFHLRTDERGAFRITPFLPARRVLLMAERDGCRPVVKSVQDLAPGDRSDRDLGDLSLAPPEKPLRLLVLLPDGKPAARMLVSFERVLPDVDRTMISASFRTDADGWVTSAFLEEGAAYLLFPGGGWEGAPPRFEARDGGRIELAKMPFPEKAGDSDDGE